MANEDHLVILREAVEGWNRWREANPDTVPDFTGANLSWSNLRESNLAGAQLSEARLRYVSLYRADLSGADLEHVDLRMAGLGRADLRDARLPNADCRAADLKGADMQGADLTGANLTGANLTGAILSGATFDGAEFGGTVLEDNDLSQVRGLEAAVHRGPSTLGMDTVTMSGGKIPKPFLRGVGLPDSVVARVPEIVGETGAACSCFICHSGEDGTFAERLHADLQGRGVRSWLVCRAEANEEEVRPVVDPLTRIRDRLVLVLSAHALEEGWPAKEAQAALREERRRGEAMLLPIRVDGTVADCGDAWAVELGEGREIWDFEGWETDEAKYGATLGDLMRRLTVESA
ncbi:MAG: toll/interleukin-1 receptor domain-containing protein [Candidatus Latescibacteria bacterium]|nr:toll/interleukin-1 receptor domain-containing protein [Candidatus Latescibacterota bacterium]